jgi:hypothetical protein
MNELHMTDRIAVSTYVQGNGPETDTYTDKETAFEIRAALRERFENISTLGLTELVAKLYEVVKLKGNESPDKWFSDMLYLNEQFFLLKQEELRGQMLRLLRIL